MKRITIMMLMIFSITLFSGCDSVNIDNPSDSPGEHEGDVNIAVEVLDSETEDGLDRAHMEVFELEYEDFIVENKNNEGEYILSLVEPEEDDMLLSIGRHEYEWKEVSVILDEVSSLSVSLDRIEDEDFIEVEAGSSPEGVSISYDFEISRYPVTNSQYVEFLNNEAAVEQKELSDGEAAVYSGEEEDFKLLDLNEDYSQIGYNGDEFYLRDWNDPEGDSIDVGNYPVIEVTWYGAAAYTNWLNKEEGDAPVYDLGEKDLNYERSEVNGYRLPSLEEWEFTAGGGAEGNSTVYSGSDELDEVAWYWGNSHAAGNTDLKENQGTMPVGLKRPNELNIYDLSGNVREWTDSRSGEDDSEIYYMNGSWGTPREKDYLQVDHRLSDPPEHHRRHIGFRPVRTLTTD